MTRLWRVTPSMRKDGEPDPEYWFVETLVMNEYVQPLYRCTHLHRLEESAEACLKRLVATHPDVIRSLLIRHKAHHALRQSEVSGWRVPDPERRT